MAGEAPPIPPALRPDQFFLAEPRGAVVPRAHPESHPARVLPERPALIEAIQAFMDAYNEDPKPFVWTATVEEIMEKVNRCKAILQPQH